MATSTTLKCAGESHTGRVRTNNEDRFYMDPERGIFVVIDGVGGQAAGEIAAEEAVKRLRARLERQIGTVRARLLEGITNANNEIFRLAQTNPEWAGMACVLTAAVVEDGTLTIGHVGDTRLYKIHGGQIRKVTHDHSPVGEQEDAGQISELEAMHHPRRNEVLRDVGSAEHTPDDEGFIDIYEIPFEPDAALIMCSDGLSDLVTSEQMLNAVRQHVGNRSRTVRQLIDLANEASGKDNVTVVFVEGEQFASTLRRQLLGLAADDAHAAEPAPARERTARETTPARGDEAAVARPAAAARSATPRIPAATSRATPPAPNALHLLVGRGALFVYGLALGVLLMAFVLKRFSPGPEKVGEAGGVGGGQQARAARIHTVGPQGAEHTSINAAIERAEPGHTVLVAPGAYREAVRLKEGVHLVSQSPREAVILPPEGEQDFVAVSAVGVRGARLVGFRIADEGGRLETGIRLTGSSVEVENVDVSGARAFGVELRNSTGSLSASFIHKNARGGVLVADGAYPRLVQNLFSGNNVRSTPLSRERTIDVEITQAARARLSGNVFTGTKDNVLGAVEWEAANFFEAKPQGEAPPPAEARQPPG